MSTSRDQDRAESKHWISHHKIDKVSKRVMFQSRPLRGCDHIPNFPVPANKGEAMEAILGFGLGDAADRKGETCRAK